METNDFSNHDATTRTSSDGAPQLNALAELRWRTIVNDLLDSLHPYQRSILGCLAISNHLNSNPVPLLTSLGCELPGKQGSDLIQMANLLESGNDPFKTMEQFPKLVPPQAIVLLRLAEQDGMLKWVFRLIRLRFPRLGRTRAVGLNPVFGLYLKALFVLGLSGFMLLKIVPELGKIFQEFGFRSERFSLAVRYLDGMGTGLGFLTLLLLLSGLTWLLVRILGFCFGRRPWQDPPAPRIVTRNRFLGSLAQTGSLGNTLERFATSASLKRLLPRLNSVRNRMLQGRDAWSALADNKLISRSDADRVSLVSPETQAWLMRAKASKQERRFEMSWLLGGRVVWVVVQIALVAVVLMTCLIVLGGLIDLLDGLAKSI
jgi:hypothetical protein